MALLWEDPHKKALCSPSVCLPPLRTERPPRSQTPLERRNLTFARFHLSHPLPRCINAYNNKPGAPPREVRDLRYRNFVASDLSSRIFSALGLALCNAMPTPSMNLCFRK